MPFNKIIKYWSFLDHILFSWIILTFTQFFNCRQIVVQRNWVFVTNSNLLSPISLQSDRVNLWYFKLWLFNIMEFIIWNIWGLKHLVTKILWKDWIPFQRLGRFLMFIGGFWFNFFFFFLSTGTRLSQNFTNFLNNIPGIDPI